MTSESEDRAADPRGDWRSDLESIATEVLKGADAGSPQDARAALEVFEKVLDLLALLDGKRRVERVYYPTEDEAIAKRAAALVMAELEARKVT